MENQYPQYEGNIVYDFEEKDPAVVVEYYNPCPMVSKPPTIYFDGLSWDECGLVLKYRNGDNMYPCTFEMKLVLSCSFESMRTFKISAHQENKLWEIMELAQAHNMKFRMYRCKHTNYYNWCMQQGFYGENDELYHYIIVAVDTWIDVFCRDEPRAFCSYFGKELSESALNTGSILDAFYDYKEKI